MSWLLPRFLAGLLAVLGGGLVGLAFRDSAVR